MRKRDRLAIRGTAIVAVCLLGSIWSASARAQNSTSAIPSQKQLASKATNTLDLRDAPIRSSLELLLYFCGASYSIDPRIGNPEIKMAGDLSTAVGKRDLTTVRFTNKPFDEALRLLRQSAPSPITVSIEHDKTTPLIYVFKPEKRDALLPASVHKDTEETAGRMSEKETFTYRVCGIVRHDEPAADKKACTTTWLALLTRDVPKKPSYAAAKIVRLNAWMAGIGENSPPLRVTGIDAKGITIQPLGGTAYQVPLASVAERKNGARVTTSTSPNPVPSLVPISHAPESEVEEFVDTLTVRGASARSAMEMILQANNIPYVIDDAFPKGVANMNRTVYRHKPREEQFDNILKMVLRLSPVGVTYHYDTAPNAKRLIIAPRSSNGNNSALTPLPLSISPLQPKYVNERQVPRRVRGLLLRDVYYRGDHQPTASPYALLERDAPGAAMETVTEIVKLGSQISTPIKGGPPVQVVGIDTEGVWLQAEGDEPFRIPLEPLHKK